MTERESAHPGSCEIPAELVTANNEERTRSFNDNCVPKRIPNTNVKVNVKAVFWFRRSEKTPRHCIRYFGFLRRTTTHGSQRLSGLSRGKRNYRYRLS